MPSAGSPDIERAFALSHAATTAVLFLAPGAISFVVEPWLFLLADRHRRVRHRFVAGGLAAMALAALGAALAPNALILSLALSLWWCGTGIATSIAQAMLVDAAPEQRARTLARWTLAGNVGDLLAPALLAGLAALHLGWRAGFATVAAILAASAAAVALHPGVSDVGRAPPTADDEPPPEPLLRALRAALADRVLLAWLFGMVLCDLLDEILVMFASLHARERFGAGPIAEGALLGSLMIGGMVGLVALERALAARSERRLLVACSLACTVAYGAWLAAPTLPVAIALAFPVGAASAPLYPLVAARAYARAPSRSGVVLAASHLFTPLGLLLPILLGLLADRAGTLAALLALGAQPVGLALLGSFARDAPQ